jgi:hypothetical protein
LLIWAVLVSLLPAQSRRSFWCRFFQKAATFFIYVPSGDTMAQNVTLSVRCHFLFLNEINRLALGMIYA